MHQRDEANERRSNRMAELKTIRDEIRLDLHLASMDLRDEWREIERRLPDPVIATEQLKDAAAGALDELATELRRFRDRLRQRKG